MVLRRLSRRPSRRPSQRSQHFQRQPSQAPSWHGFMDGSTASFAQDLERTATGATEDDHATTSEVVASEDHGLYTIESAESGEFYDSIGRSDSATQIDHEGGDGDTDTSASVISNTLSSLPSIILVSVLNLMLSVPFGSAYFSNDVPLGIVERQALGMRLCLLSGAISQVIFGCLDLSTLNPVATIQMAALTPFYHQLCYIAKVVANNVNDESSSSYILPTTLYLISLSTFIAGLSYYVVGRLGLAKVTSFFPRYTLLGLVGGCGVFFMCLSISVSVGPDIAPDANWTAIVHSTNRKFLLTAAFAVGIRILRAIISREKFMLLDAVYFLSVPVLVYAGMHMMGISFNRAVELGYFFKDPNNADIALDVREIVAAQTGWHHINLSLIRWEAALPAMTTFFSLSLLSIMLSVPYPPLLSVYLGSESTFDIEKEFKVHGYANIIVGAIIPGGLFVFESYANTLLFKNAGAIGGKICNGLLAVGVFIFAIYGSVIVDSIPRCMAGTLVLDMGITLFLSAVSVTDFSLFEYVSVWVIIMVMIISDMTTALVVALILALFNFTQQSFVAENPVRRIIDVSKMPSTCVRSIEALQVLDDNRKAVILFQLQGHLFYGNFPKLKEEILQFLNQKDAKKEKVTMAIVDFDFVVGIDSSAAGLMEKMIATLKEERGIETVFVKKSHFDEFDDISTDTIYHAEEQKQIFSMSIITEAFEIRGEYYKHFDEALVACEDTLLRRHRMGLEKKYTDSVNYRNLDATKVNIELERDTILMFLSKYNAGHAPPYTHRPNSAVLVDVLDVLERETYSKGDILWQEGDVADSAKILVKGSFYAMSERDSEYTGPLKEGRIIGLRSLLLADGCFAGLRCDSDDGLVYSLDMNGYKALRKNSPDAARVVDMAMARNLSLRLEMVQSKAGIGLM